MPTTRRLVQDPLDKDKNKKRPGDILSRAERVVEEFQLLLQPDDSTNVTDIDSLDVAQPQPVPNGVQAGPKGFNVLDINASTPNARGVPITPRQAMTPEELEAFGFRNVGPDTPENRARLNDPSISNAEIFGQDGNFAALDPIIPEPLQTSPGQSVSSPFSPSLPKVEGQTPISGPQRGKPTAITAPQTLGQGGQAAAPDFDVEALSLELAEASGTNPSVARSVIDALYQPLKFLGDVAGVAAKAGSKAVGGGGLDSAKFQRVMSALAKAASGGHEDTFGFQLSQAGDALLESEQQSELISQLDSGVPISQAMASPRLYGLSQDSQLAALDTVMKKKAAQQEDRRLDQNDKALEIQESLGLKNVSVNALSAYLNYLTFAEGLRGAKGGKDLPPAAKVKISQDLLSAMYGKVLPKPIREYINPTDGSINSGAVLSALPKALQPSFLRDIQAVDSALAASLDENTGQAVLSALTRSGGFGNPIQITTEQEAVGVPPGTFMVNPQGIVVYKDIDGSLIRVDVRQ